jgi:hypothetical protein
VIVISDNSALSALAEAGLTDLLPRLFGTVVIPEAVHRESSHPRAPGTEAFEGMDQAAAGMAQDRAESHHPLDRNR